MDSGEKAALFFWYPLFVVWGAAVLVPLALIAVGMSFIVSVELWVGVLVVLSTWPVAERIMWPTHLLLHSWRRAILAEYGIGAAWVIGALALAHALGPQPVLVILIPAASVLTYWGLRRLAAWTPEGLRLKAEEERRMYGRHGWRVDQDALRDGDDGLHVQFRSKKLPGRTYAWDFGDGSGSDLASPSHDYAKPGAYEVTLTFTEAGVAQSITKIVGAGPDALPPRLARRDGRTPCQKSQVPGPKPPSN